MTSSGRNYETYAERNGYSPEDRNIYFKALETAQVENDPIPFGRFIMKCISLSAKRRSPKATLGQVLSDGYRVKHRRSDKEGKIQRVHVGW